MFLILANSLMSDEKYLSGVANDHADFLRSGLRNFNITELKFMLGLFQLWHSTATIRSFDKRTPIVESY